jgi:hypothetical protein
MYTNIIKKTSGSRLAHARIQNNMAAHLPIKNGLSFAINAIRHFSVLLKN